MNIIKSDIINTNHDVFWEDISLVIKDASPKPVLIIVNKYEIGSPEEVQLLRMMDACKLTPQQYNIIQLYPDQQLAWYQLAEKLAPNFIFLIGIHPAQLGISAMFRLNEPNNFSGKIWLPTVSVNELEKFTDIKTQLWQNGMKPIFVLQQFGEIK